MLGLLTYFCFHCSATWSFAKGAKLPCACRQLRPLSAPNAWTHHAANQKSRPTRPKPHRKCEYVQCALSSQPSSLEEAAWFALVYDWQPSPLAPSSNPSLPPFTLCQNLFFNISPFLSRSAFWNSLAAPAVKGSHGAAEA
jgi:hypothetical protein